MYILSVKFGVNSPKTYDYLYVNPKGVAVDSSRPLRVSYGATKAGLSCKSLIVVKKTRMDILPDWVTAQIVVDEDNLCTTEKISAKHVEILRSNKPRTTTSSKRQKTAKKNSTKEHTPCPCQSYKDIPLSIGAQKALKRQQEINEIAGRIVAKLFKD